MIPMSSSSRPRISADIVSPYSLMCHIAATRRFTSNSLDKIESEIQTRMAGGQDVFRKARAPSQTGPQEKLVPPLLPLRDAPTLGAKSLSTRDRRRGGAIERIRKGVHANVTRVRRPPTRREPTGYSPKTSGSRSGYFPMRGDVSADQTGCMTFDSNIPHAGLPAPPTRR